MSIKKRKKFIAYLLCLVTLTAMIPTNASAQFELLGSETEGEDQSSNDHIKRDATILYKLIDEEEFKPLPETIEDSTKVEKFHASYSFEINDNIDDTTGQPNRTIKEGDYYYIQLPKEINISDGEKTSIIYKDANKDSKEIAHYQFKKNDETGNWQIKITFADIVNDLNELQIKGTFNFVFTLDLKNHDYDDIITIEIPIDEEKTVDIDVIKPASDSRVPVSLEKTVSSYNEATRELVWNVAISPSDGIFGDCIFTDTIDTTNLKLESVQHGPEILEKDAENGYSFDESTGLLTYIIPEEGRNGTPYKDIKITTSVKSSVYGKLEATSITNQAYLKKAQAGVDISSDPVTYVIRPGWLNKTGSKINGNQIEWTIRANSSKHSMYNALITDKFNSDVKLDMNNVRVDGNLISVHTSAYTPHDSSEIYGIYTENYDDTSELKIYLERGRDNAKASERVVTLVTDVVPVSDPKENSVYNNTASLNCNYDTGGQGEGEIHIADITTEGVAVPKIFVDKGYKEMTADDKRNGTITWIIKAASNYSNYNKAQIVDTLPDDLTMAQTYIEAQWLDPNTDEFVTLDEETEPKALISEDGKQLTITFEEIGKALSKEQIFHVKTKMSSDAYGKNLDKDFRNDVKAILLDSNDKTIAMDDDYSYIRVKNSLISKTNKIYNTNLTKQGVNPRVNFEIIINGNLMNLKDVKITDDLNRISTQFKKVGEDTAVFLEGLKWTYLEDSIKIKKISGDRDSFELGQISARTNGDYDPNTNVLSVDFGQGVEVNDSYSIEFTAELDLSKLKDDEIYNVFKENGTIICQGNIADIEGLGVAGKISTPATEDSGEIKNEVLDKSGVYNKDEGQIMWTLKFNQRRIKLDNTKVEDILPDGLSLDPTSIRLYKDVIGEDGNFISGVEAEKSATEVSFNYSYEVSEEEETIGRNVLTVDLPDNEADYILRFATDVDSRIVGSQVHNTASYIGEQVVNPGTSSTSITIQGHGAGSSVTKTSIKVNKYSKDKKDNPLLLDGAVFELRWLTDGDIDKSVFVRRLETKDGTVTFYGLTIGETYSVSEVQSPEGYLLDDFKPLVFKAQTDGIIELESGEQVSEINFGNTPIKRGSWQPQAIKYLHGRELDQAFQFEILDDNDKLVMIGSTKDKLPDGGYSIEFQLEDGVEEEGVLSFSDKHIFDEEDPEGTEKQIDKKTFKMKELLPELKTSGYIYDETVHELNLHIINVKGEDDLRIIIKDKDGNNLSDDSGRFTNDKIPTFNNLYMVKDSLQLTAEKLLRGQPLAENQFVFQLYEGNEIKEEFLIEEVKNGAATLKSEGIYGASVIFSPIEFSQDDIGRRTYTIIEKNTGLDAYIYDDTVFNIELEIFEGDDGTLDFIYRVTRVNDESSLVSIEDIVFENTYKEEPIDPEEPTEAEEPTEVEEPSEAEGPTEAEEPSDTDKTTQPKDSNTTDTDKKITDVPKTNDYSNIRLMSAILLTASLGIIALILYYKKEIVK